MIRNATASLPDPAARTDACHFRRRGVCAALLLFLTALLVLLPLSTSFASLNWNPDDGFPPLEEVGQGGTEPPDSELVILEGTVVVNPKGGDPGGRPNVPVSGGNGLQTGSGASAPGSGNGNAASDASVGETSQFSGGDFSASGDPVADDGVIYFARTADGGFALPGRQLILTPESRALLCDILKAIDEYQSSNPSDDAVLNWPGGSGESANALTPQHITLLAAAWLSNATSRPIPNPDGPNLANPAASSYEMTNFVQMLSSDGGTPVVGSSELPQHQLGGEGDAFTGLQREINLINANGDAANAGRSADQLAAMADDTMLDNLAKLGFSTPSGKLGDALKLLYDVYHYLLRAVNTYPGLSGSAAQTGGDSFFALLDTARSAQGGNKSLAVSLYSDTTSDDNNAQLPEPPAIQTKPPLILGGGIRRIFTPSRFMRIERWQKSSALFPLRMPPSLARQINLLRLRAKKSRCPARSRAKAFPLRAGASARRVQTAKRRRLIGTESGPPT